MQGLDISSALLRVRVLPFGASLVGVWHAARARNLVLGFADPADHSRVPIYAGAIVGPVANRITGGTVPIDGTLWQMAQNDHGRHSLHSGEHGLHARTWQVTHRAAGRLTLALTLDHGACGLPGQRQITADYHINDDTLILTLEARTDRLTPMSLAPHAYWNLDGRADLTTHHLSIEADYYLATGPENLPSGDIAPVQDTMFDFNTARPVPLSPDLDVNYCLSDGLKSDEPKSDRPQIAPRPAAILTGADGIKLQIATTAPGLQVYNGSGLPTLPNALTGGRPLAPYGAIALEPQYWPDAPHNARFPDIMLHPGQRFRQITHYRIGSATV